MVVGDLMNRILWAIAAGSVEFQLHTAWWGNEKKTFFLSE
jgi:hypothetical protein